jgi:hypothetical protein
MTWRRDGRDGPPVPRPSDAPGSEPHHHRQRITNETNRTH